MKISMGLPPNEDARLQSGAGQSNNITIVLSKSTQSSSRNSRKRISPLFADAARYAKLIQGKTDKRRAIRHLCKKWRKAINGEL